MSGKIRFANGGANDQAILDSFYLFPGVHGNVYFVDSVNGNANGPGFAPGASAYATLAQALAVATASNGDVIYLCPGHVETITGAAGLTIALAGIRIIGLGVGRNRPTWSFTTSTAAQLIVSAANVLIENVVFDLTGITAIVAAISVTGADVSFVSCEFVISTGTNAPVLGILTAATATRFRVENCRFLGAATSTATCTACIQHEAGVDYLIKGSFFCGKLTQAILNVATVLRGLITDNDFVIGTANVAITMAAASTPFISKNRFNVAGGTAPIVAAAGFLAGNSYSAAAGVTAGAATTF